MSMKPFSSYSPEVAEKKRADMSKMAQEGWKNRDENGLGAKKSGWTDRSKKKMSKSMKGRWKGGAFKDRVHGTAGKYAAKHHNWRSWGKYAYREILSQHEVQVCRICGNKQYLQAHHIDQNRENYLLSNLLWACRSCHAWYFHFRCVPCCGHVCPNRPIERPWVRAFKDFNLQYTRILPSHPGEDEKAHMKSGTLKVMIRGRINREFKEDFYDLCAITKKAIIENLNHSSLNDYLKNPTLKNLLVWIWRRLEEAGLKGLYKLEFSEKNSRKSAVLTVKEMLETHGWDRVNGKWKLIRKPINGQKVKL